MTSLLECQRWGAKRREKGRRECGPHEVITGIHLAKSVSIIVSRRGSLRWTVCERKFESMRTEYGGMSAVLYWKKSDEETWGTSRTIVSVAFFFSLMSRLS
jgi:hypothetical protein